MAFDINNQADLTALKTEVETDPLGMNYNLNSTPALLKSLNDGDENIGGETVQGDLTPKILWELAAANPDDFTPHGQFSEGDKFVMQQLFEVSERLDDDLNWARAGISNMFPANDGFRQDLEALSRALSRAEVLFGEGTSISRNDLIEARSKG